MDLKKRVQEAKIELPKEFWQDIQSYKKQLLLWNKTHNLTGAKDEKKLDEFIFDALYPVSFLTPPKSMLDIGTGAGFPGLILAIIWRESEITLAEPLTKRASFLQFIKAKLHLNHVTVARKRAEDLPPKEFELITSRAVTDTKLLLQISQKLRNEETKLLFYKGERVFDEVEEDLPHKVIMANKRHYLLIGKDEGL
ncbi:rRNA small subunit 7-methylguanosine (m7G) methyltransferase GidB [hydrothermal vent metagenome]|uniref:rRNA small subunit 7-methylguanosine (M7G) methyltransferase GidB n=1 Tax=hydrothermal vent metagenome TaxID=652676 RepID=A0A1W1C4B3_9ZZZZ